MRTSMSCTNHMVPLQLTLCCNVCVRLVISLCERTVCVILTADTSDFTRACVHTHTHTHTHTHYTQVKGITGPSRGLIGTLINIDEGDGIVKLDADSALKIISLNQFARYVPKLN